MLFLFFHDNMTWSDCWKLAAMERWAHLGRCLGCERQQSNPTGGTGMDSPCQAYRDSHTLWVTVFWKMDMLYHGTAFYKISLLPIKPATWMFFTFNPSSPSPLFYSAYLSQQPSPSIPHLPLLMLNTPLVLHSNTIKNVHSEPRDFKHLNRECQWEENCIDVILRRSSISRKSRESLIILGEAA